MERPIPDASPRVRGGIRLPPRVPVRPDARDEEDLRTLLQRADQRHDRVRGGRGARATRGRQRRRRRARDVGADPPQGELLPRDADRRPVHEGPERAVPDADVAVGVQVGVAVGQRGRAAHAARPRVRFSRRRPVAFFHGEARRDGARDDAPDDDESKERHAARAARHRHLRRERGEAEPAVVHAQGTLTPPAGVSRDVRGVRSRRRRKFALSVGRGGGGDGGEVRGVHQAAGSPGRESRGEDEQGDPEGRVLRGRDDVADGGAGEAREDASDDNRAGESHRGRDPRGRGESARALGGGRATRRGEGEGGGEGEGEGGDRGGSDGRRGGAAEVSRRRRRRWR
eukprot:31134-Pelagococcus_subviridis.AAC.5